MSILLQAADGTSLKNKSLFFFILTALLTLIATVGVFGQSRNTADGLPVFILMTLAFLLCTLVAAMICFQHYVIKPLDDMNTTAELMIDGHLDSLNRIKRTDEIGCLSERINDLAINMQEVLLVVWNHSQERHDLLERVAAQLDVLSDTEQKMFALKDDITKLSQDNEDFKNIVTSFHYFEIRLEHERMLSKSDCQ